MELSITNLHGFNKFIESNKAVVLYFSTPDCNVCTVLKPKLKKLLRDHFPKMKFAYVNIPEAKELARQNSVFAVPAILFFFEGKELLRKSRNINLSEVHRELNRLYSLIFD